MTASNTRSLPAHYRQPPKSFKTHSVLSPDGQWRLAFSPVKKGGYAVVNINLVPTNGYTKGGMTLILSEELGYNWGFNKQPCGNYWFQIGTSNPHNGLAVDFSRQFWDWLVADGWKPMKENSDGKD